MERQYLVFENGIAKRVVEASSQMDAKQKTGLLSAGNIRCEAKPPSRWTQSDQEDVCHLTRMEKACCIVCGKDLGKMELQFAQFSACEKHGGIQ